VDTVNTIFQFLSKERQPLNSPAYVILSGKPLRIKKILVIRYYKNPFLTIDLLFDSKGLSTFQLNGLAGFKYRIIVWYLH